MKDILKNVAKAIALKRENKKGIHQISISAYLRSLSQGSTNSNMLDLQGGAHKKRVRRSSLLNAKKLYEDALMARKVKQYLSNLSVEADEEKHQILSLHCEPSYSTRESQDTLTLPHYSLETDFTVNVQGVKK